MNERTLEALGLDAAPREQPLIYPGAWPSESGLLHRNTYLRLRPGPGAGPAQWLVEGLEAGGPLPLDQVLRDAGEPLTGDRIPVLSIGSNACPGQLRHKMGGLGVSSTIPMVKVRATGILAGVSANVSPLGYVSASPFHAPGRTRDLFVTWLDAVQLKIVDDSEGVFTPDGEYDRVLLPAGRFPMETPSGELLGGVHAYVHRRGVIHDGTGVARVHPGERQLLTQLLAESPRLREWFGGTPEEFSSRARGNRPLCEKGTQLFRDEGRVTPSGLEDLVDGVPGSPSGDGFGT
ncbi:hypothetical protein OG782_03425 [Streptomyces sp. NBC_00876]|uniref:hypothetical protein n=1 Tax=Streptomyces sp. NBC_00876 TaxID=2975853 RepID=UPI003867D81F|nr:hypothetical protein OG782_03425 [Streptomyces sp. NBC_00876]